MRRDRMTSSPALNRLAVVRYGGLLAWLAPGRPAIGSSWLAGHDAVGLLRSNDQGNSDGRRQRTCPARLA